MKKSLSLTAATLVALSLTACGGGGSDNTSPTQTTTANDSSQSTTTESSEVIVRVVDGYVLNANVRDALGNTAIELGDGQYKFENGITYPIIANGGTYKATGEAFDIVMLAYEGEVVSPITTIVGNGTNTTLFNAFSSALGTGTDTSALAMDYVDSNNTEFAKAAQLAHLLIKDNNIESFQTHLNTQAAPTDINELIEQSKTMIQNFAMSDIEKTIKTNYLQTIQDSTVGGAEFEAFVGSYKYNLNKVADTDDYDGDGVPNRLEIIFGLDLTNPTDINGSADTDDDGVRDVKEMFYAYTHRCRDGNYNLDPNYEADCDYKYDEAIDGLTHWNEQTTEDGLIISIDEQYATDNGLSYISVADDLGSTLLKTHSEAVEYCQNLEFGGFNDWRLPTGNEAKDIFARESTSRIIDSKYLDLFLHAEVLTHATITNVYPANFFKRRATWTQDLKSEEEAYYIGLWQETGGFEYIGGSTVASSKTDEYNSICVRTYR
jgi:hypothetical protein